MEFEIIKKVPLNKVTSLIALIILCANFTFHPLVNAAPQGGNIVGGSGSISQSGLNTTIQQNTSSLAINWNSFNIGIDERVQFIQPSSSSMALNRILGQSGSQIFGQLDANGHILLVNPNGVFFSPTATVNVGGLIASGLDINPVDFMNGDYLFKALEGTEGTVINSGLLNASLGGSISLLGKQVDNDGLIVAKLGAINLAAGKEAILTFDDAGLVGVRISMEVLQEELGVTPALLNSGEIKAEGGRVLLTASVSQNVFSQAVNAGDIEHATSVVVYEDGSFTLGAGAEVVNTGKIDVSIFNSDQNAGQVAILGENITSSGVIKANADITNGGDIELHASNTTLLTENSIITARSESNGKGGIVKILGDRVGLFDQSTVDVSGTSGGGQVLIGGDYQGKNNQIKNSQRTVVSKDTQIFADALSKGNGGEIILWSDGTTVFNGFISSTGGEIIGNGGFIEISGKNNLGFYGETDKSAVNGEVGTLLLDPDDINIIASAPANNDSELDDRTILFDDGGTNNPNDFDISATKIIAELNNGNVTIAANGRIDIETTIDASSSTSGNSLTFNTVTDEIRIQNGADITTNNADITFEGDVKLDDNGSTNIISTGSGVGNIMFTSNITSTHEDNTLELNAGTGNIDIQGNVASNTDNNNRLNAFTITNATNVNLLDVSAETGGIAVTADTINLGGDLRTDGDIDAGIITLIGDITLTSNSVRIETDCNNCGSDANIIITGNIDDDIDVLTRELTLDSGSSNTTINGVVGGIREPLSFTIEQSGSSSVDEINTLDGGVRISSDTGIDLRGNIITNTGTNGGIVDLNGAVTLSADVSINTDATGTDGIVDFSSTLNTDATAASTALHTLTVDAGTSTVAINGIVGGIDRLLGLSITNASSITLSAVNVGSAGLTVNGGTLNLGGDIDTSAGIVDIDSVNNLQLTNSISTSGGDVFIDITDATSGYFRNDANDGSSISSGTGNVAITTAGNDGSRGVRLGAITTTGTGALSVTTTNGSIVQSTDADRDLDISGISSFNAGTDSITLNNNSNDFTVAVSFTTSSNALVNDSSSIILGTSNITGSGNFEVKALNGGISQLTGSVLTVNGETAFTSTNGDIIANNSGNNFIGVVNIDNTGGNAVTLRDDNIYTLGTSSLTGGTYTVNAGTDINLPTSLSVNGSASSLVLNAGNDINITANPLTGSGSLALTFNSDADASAAGQINLNTALIESGDSAITFNGDTILQVSSTVDSGTSKVDFTSTLDATTARIETLDIVAGDVDFDGTVGTTRLGDLTIDSTGDITVLSTITSNLLDIVNSNSFNNNGFAINTEGDSDTAGGAVTILAGTSINIGNIGTNAGGSTGTSGGQVGGDVILTAANISVSDIITLGGDASGNSQTGGIGGAITITAITDGITKKVTLNGDLDRRSGFSTDAFGVQTTRDNSQTVSINLNDTGAIDGEVILVRVGNFTSGLQITGSNDSDTLFAANNATNNWLIDANSGGSLNSLNIQFSNIENLTGGTADDSFIFSGAGDVINIDGNGGAINSITGKALVTNGWALTAANQGSVSVGGVVYIDLFVDIQLLSGGTSTDNFTVFNNDNTWALSDLGSAAAGSGTIQDTSATISIITFSNMENLFGGALADIFNIADSASIAGIIQGGAGADVFNITGLNINTTIDGGTGSDTLNGFDAANTWTLDGSALQTLVALSGGTVRFGAIENLVGNGTSDDFILSATATVSSINGNGGINSITGKNVANDWTLTNTNEGNLGVTAGALYVNTFSDIQTIIGGSNTDTLTGHNNDNTWNITTPGSGNILDTSASTSIINFNNFENLVGDNTGTDSFVVSASGGLAGTVVGGTGIGDSLTLDIVDALLNSWVITGQDSGRLAGVINTAGAALDDGFTGIESIKGSDDDDTFTIENVAFISNINGGNNDNILDPNDIVNFSGLGSAFIVNLGSSSGFANIDELQGNTLNPQLGTLVGDDISNTWVISGTNSGAIGGYKFSGFANLTGGNVEDIFNFTADDLLVTRGNITGLIDGGANIGSLIDVVNVYLPADLTNGAVATSVVVQLDGVAGAAAIANGFIDLANINSVNVNGAASNTLRGGDGLNFWDITANQSGTVNSADFTGFSVLKGGISDDIFTITETNLTDALTIYGSDSDINSLDTIIGGNVAITWNVSGINAGSLIDNDGAANIDISFINIGNLTGQADVNDTFNITAGSISGNLTGGTGTGIDEIVNQLSANTDWIITGNNQGSVGAVASFTGIENLTGSNTFEDTFTLQAGGISGTVSGGTSNADEIINELITASSWNITGADQGDVEGIVNFININNLTGADAADDTFNLAAGGSVSGIVNGGTGNDTLVSQLTADTSWNVTGDSQGNLTGINNFTGIENLTGANDVVDTFNMADGSIIQGTITGGTGAVNDEIINAVITASTWNITGGNQGNLEGIVFAFSDIESLTGSNDVSDTFNIQVNGILSGILTGGTGAVDDSIVNLTGAAIDWNITALNEGYVTGINAFTGIENLTGTDSANDVFYLAQNGGISGIVDGGASGNDEIISQRSTDTIWNITSADTGNVNGITLFADIENLTGNIQNDTFNYTVDASSISGIVRGNLLTGQTDADVVDMSGMTTSVLDVVLGTDFIDIEKFIGNSRADSTFTAQNLNNNWEIFDLGVSTPTNTNQGTVTDSNLVEVTFVSFNNITGGDQADNFLIEPNGDILGTINGGAGNDTIDLSLQAGVIDKTVGSVLSGLGSVINIEGIKGNGDQSILRVSDAGSSWTITGLNSGTVTSGSDTTTFIDFNILQGGNGDDIFTVTETGAIGDQVATDLVSRINGGAGNDSLTITLSGNDAKINLFAADGIVSNDGNLTFSSTSGSNDSIQINGALANFDTAIYSVDYTSAQAIHSYSSAATSASVAYTGVEVVNDFVQAANLIISGAGGNDIVDINGTGIGAGTFDVTSTNIALSTDWATVNYQNKTSLSVRDLGVAGIINIMSNLELDSATGYFDFEAAQIVNAGGFTLTGNELRLDSVLVNIDSANPLLTDINKLQVSNSTADIYVLETDGINLEQADTTGFLSVVSTTGDIGDSDTQGLVSSGDLSLNALAGSILLDNAANNLMGTVSLATGTGGSATLNNSASVSATTLGVSNVGVGTLTVISTSAEIVSTDTLVAGAVVLDAGNNAINLSNANNDFDSLTVLNSASLDVTVNNATNALTLNELNASGTMNIAANGITVDGIVESAGDTLLDAQTGDVSLNNTITVSTGDLTITGNNILQSGDIAAQAGNINLTSVGNYLMNADIGADQNITLVSQTGDIAQNGLINSDQGDIVISSVSGAITMGATTAATATNGNVQYSAEGNVNVALLSALNGTAAASSNSGQIIDSNGTAANFKSITLELDAVTGIGNSKALETEVAVMDIHNTSSGDIKLQQTGSVEFIALHNIQSNGLVDVRSNGDFIFNPGSVAVSRDQGTIFMSTSSGSFLGKGFFDLQNADITANVATFFALSGTFGTTARPLVLDVPTSGSVLIDSRTSSIRFFPETPDDLVTTGIDIGALGVVSAVAGEQLVEIESLGDIDPAIFTDLQNYSQAETSIRMPRDQLFDDELEEENQQI